MNMYTYLGMCLTMTYLRKYAYTSLGMSFLMGCLAQVKYLPRSPALSAIIGSRAPAGMVRAATAVDPARMVQPSQADLLQRRMPMCAAAA